MVCVGGACPAGLIYNAAVPRRVVQSLDVLVKVYQIPVEGLKARLQTLPDSIYPFVDVGGLQPVLQKKLHGTGTDEGGILPELYEQYSSSQGEKDDVLISKFVPFLGEGLVSIVAEAMQNPAGQQPGGSTL